MPISVVKHVPRFDIFFLVSILCVKKLTGRLSKTIEPFHIRSTYFVSNINLNVNRKKFKLKTQMLLRLMYY